MAVIPQQDDGHFYILDCRISNFQCRILEQICKQEQKKMVFHDLLEIIIDSMMLSERNEFLA